MLTLLAALTLAAPATMPGEPLPPSQPSFDAVLAAALAPVAPLQEESDEAWDFSYTFIELGTSFYNPDLDVDDFDDEVDTYYGTASLGLFKFLYLFAGYENQDFEFEDSSTDIIRLGVGGHFSVAPKFDLLGDIAWLYSDLSSDLSELDDSNTGYEIRAGARWMPINWNRGGIELNGGLKWRELDNQIASDDSLFGWDVGARVHFLKLFSIGASYTMMEDDDAALLNARVSF